MSAPPPAPPPSAPLPPVACPQHILDAIHGPAGQAGPAKRAAYEKSLTRWWSDYAARKNDEEEEHVADSLLYDRNHLPRSAPAPDCVAAAGGGTASGAERVAEGQGK